MAGTDSQGVTIGYGTPTVTAVGSVTSIDGPNPSAETIDVTALDSTGGYREFITSFKDGGEVTFGINFVPSDVTQQALWTKFNANTVDTWTIGFPDGETEMAFSAYISTPPGVSASVGSVITGQVTLRLTGPVTVTWPAP